MEWPSPRDFCRRHPWCVACTLHQRPTKCLARSVESKVMQTFTDMGMELNDSKARALLTLQGSKGQSMRNKVTRVLRKQRHLCIPIGDAERFIPVAANAEYLGTIISYPSLERQTVAHRVQKARTRFRQLQKILTRRRGLQRRQCLQLWTVIIRPRLLYGRTVVPFSPHLLHMVTSLAMRHIRTITCTWSFNAGVTDQTLLASCQLSSTYEVMTKSLPVEFRGLMRPRRLL